MTRKTIGKMPLDNLVPDPSTAPKSSKAAKPVALYVRLSPELDARLKAMAYWEREPVSEIVRRAIEHEIATAEKKHGGPYQARK